MGSCLSRESVVTNGDELSGAAHIAGVKPAADRQSHSARTQPKRGKADRSKLPEIHTAPPVAKVDIWEAPTATAGKSAAVLMLCIGLRTDAKRLRHDVKSKDISALRDDSEEQGHQCFERGHHIMVGSLRVRLSTGGTQAR